MSEPRSLEEAEGLLRRWIAASEVIGWPQNLKAETADYLNAYLNARPASEGPAVGDRDEGLVKELRIAQARSGAAANGVLFWRGAAFKLADAILYVAEHSPSASFAMRGLVDDVNLLKSENPYAYETAHASGWPNAEPDTGALTASQQQAGGQGS